MLVGKKAFKIEFRTSVVPAGSRKIEDKKIETQKTEDKKIEA